MPTFIQTFTGREVDLESFCAADIVHFDIAIPLSRIARFNGHTREFYSVAEHSVLAAIIAQHERLDPATILAALLHDAHEAYTGDWISHVKQHAGAKLLGIADDIQAVIYDFYGCQKHDRQAVKQIDLALLHAERRDLLAGETRNEIWGPPPAMTAKIPRIDRTSASKDAGYLFLRTLDSLKGVLDARTHAKAGRNHRRRGH